MNLKYIILTSFFLYNFGIFAQNYKPKKNKEKGSEYGGYSIKRNKDFKAFKLVRISGEANLKGLYREQHRLINEYSETEKYSMISAGLIVRTNSYIFHPNFLTLDLDGEYNPERIKDNYLIIPDRAETNNLKKVEGRATFFKEKQITLIALGGYNEAYSNRENLTNIKSTNLNYGGRLDYKNKFLPASVIYNDRKWEQIELDTKRKFDSKQKNLEAKISKSFATTDKNDLTFNYNEYFRNYANQYEVKNISNQLKLTNDIAFDKKRKYVFNSYILGIDQIGFDEYKKINSNQRLYLNLPKNIQFNANYNYNVIERQKFTLNQQRTSAKLGHKLYESLYSNIFFEYSQSSHTLFKETNYKEGIDFLYKKKIPTGLITLSYKFERQHQLKSSNPSDIQVFNEEYTITDGQIVLLKKPYINRNSIIVTDESGTIIYQENFDYILIERESFIEIQRILGGQIANNSIVYIDYISIQPASYQYDVNNNSVSLGIQFLKWFEIYSRYSKQNYVNKDSTEFLILNYYKQYVYGGRFDFKFLACGVEYDDYRSVIIPYKLMRYYITLNGTIKQKILYSLNGTVNDYKMINNDVNQLYTDINGSLGYIFNSRTKFTVELGYRNQKGKEIELDLLTSKAELTTSLRQLYFTLGVNYYNKKYLTENIDFKGAYFKIVRKF